MGMLDRLFSRDDGVEERSYSGPPLSISDPALGEWLGLSTRSTAGVEVTESKTLGQTAFWRGVNVVANTVAGLPLKTFEGVKSDRHQVESWLDDPAEPYPIVPFTWVQTQLAQMLLYGNCYLRHNYNAAGAMTGAWPVHPSAVTPRWNGADKIFKVAMADGSDKEYTSETMTQVMGLTLDGLRGVSVLTYMRNTIGTSIAGDTAASKSFTAPLIAGIVTPDVDMEPGDAKAIKDSLMATIGGVGNAGDIAVVNRNLKFTPWAMTNADAQFIESREFELGEFARILGVPLNLLMVQGAVSNWGTGVAEANLGLSRYTLMGWTTPLEQAYKRLLPPGQFAEFEYAGLMQGTPAEEIELLIKQVDAGILTPDEARAIRNLPPLPKDALPKPAVVPDPKENAA